MVLRPLILWNDVVDEEEEEDILLVEDKVKILQMDRTDKLCVTSSLRSRRRKKDGKRQVTLS